MNTKEATLEVQGYTAAAQRIEQYAASAQHGAGACVGFRLSGFVSLEFDKGERVTPERLAKAVREAASRLLSEMAPEDLAVLLDGVHVESLNDE